jgi:hypothetical protein
MFSAIDMDKLHSIANWYVPILLLALMLALFPTGETKAEQLSYTVEFQLSDFSFDKIDEYDFVRLDGDYLADPGKPMLPCRTLKIALPDGFAVQSVRIDNVVHETVDGRYDIFPSQPPYRVGQSFDDVEFVQPDDAVYASNSAYPEYSAELVGQSDLAGQSFANVRIYPLSYVPSENRLILNSSVSLTIEGTSGYVCGDYLPSNISDRGREIYENMVTESAINPLDAQIRVGPSSMRGTSMLPPGEPFDHVLIANAAEAPYWQPLVDWHMMKGLRDTIITTSYIYANYSGSNNQERVRNFIIDAHQNWGTVYFLIAGEHSDVPFKSEFFEGDLIPSDHYYADYDDDWQLEVIVGRVTADSPTQIQRFIDKVLKYETDPARTDYALDATLVGMDLTTAMEPPYYVQTPGEELKEFIDTAYIPSRFNVTKIYDSYPGNHKTDFINALNDGQNLVNHCDHSNYSVMCVGDRNHGWCMWSSEVDALSNTGEMSVIFSIGCHANEMDFNDCIGEHFVIYNDLKAGVAFTGNTRSGWFYVGDPRSLSSQLDEVWWEALLIHDYYTLGEMLTYSKNTCPHSGIWQYCQWTLNMLGDPTMAVWTDSPEDMIVTYPDLLPVGSSVFSVHVERESGDPLANATVCLWKGSEVYSVGTTNSNGTVMLTVEPSTIGEMSVTVTAHNFVPHLGSATVTTDNIAPTCNTPGDTVINLCELVEVCIPVGCYDPNGNLQSGPTIISGPGVIEDGFWCYTPSGDETFTVTLECMDTGGLSCESAFEVHFNPNDPPVCSDIDDVHVVQCEPEQIVVPLGLYDEDGNIAISQVVDGPGIILHGNWVYTPAEGTDTVDVLVRFTDGCGESCETSFRLTSVANMSPICELPNDSTIVQCTPAPVSLPVVSYDPDGDDPVCELIVGPGELVDGYWNYMPIGDETLNLTIRCTDTCGVYCDHQFVIDFDYNDPPVVMLTGDEVDVVMCETGEQAVPIPVYDPNGNIVEWELLSGPGSVGDGMWYYTPQGEDSVDVSVLCTDECGEEVSVSFTAMFEMNTAPVCANLVDTVIYVGGPTSIKIPCAASDDNENLTECQEVTSHGYVSDGYWYYTVTEPETLDVTIECTDDCGVSCQTEFTVEFAFLSCGDVNADAGIDIDDVVYLITYIFGGGEPPVASEAADVNCSGGVDIDDAVYIITYIFSSGPPPCASC